MEKKTFEQAVRDEVLAFVNNKCDFSAYSITTNLRTKVNTRSIEVDGLPFETIDGVLTQKVDHQSVRWMVGQMQINGELSNMGYDRYYNPAGYFYYAPANTTPIVNAAAVSGSIPVNSVQGALANQSSGNQFQAASPTDPTVVSRVLNYFTNRYSSGIPATLHTTQKCLKRTPLSIWQIEDIAKSNGWKIVTSSPYSESIVTR